MQEVGKLNLKIRIIPNVLEKYMSFTTNDKLRLIDSFQFLSSLLDSLVRNLNKNDFLNKKSIWVNNLIITF